MPTLSSFELSLFLGRRRLFTELVDISELTLMNFENIIMMPYSSLITWSTIKKREIREVQSKNWKYLFPKTSSEYLQTFIYLFSDHCSVHELEFGKLWRRVSTFWIPIFRMRKSQNVRCEKTFENWMTVTGSKIEL